MKRQFSMYGALAAFTLFWGMLTGCEADDTPGGSSSGEVVPVTISLQMDVVDQLTKAVDEDAINTLDVYIYNGSTVEKHLTETDFGDDLRAETELSEGQKTIYAIANAGSYGETAPDNTAVNAIGQWLGADATAIPMSSQLNTTWKVSKDVKEYTVKINRMVAKMNVKIVDERADKADDVSSVTISDLMAGTTNLYREGYGKVSLPTTGATISDWGWDFTNVSWDIDAEGNKIATYPYFYLHENSGSFNVSVEMKNETPRSATLQRTVIPRNHIFPLVIHIADYSLTIEVKYSLAAIGTLPVTKELNTYSFALPEGCTFDVTITPKKGKGEWNNASWTVGALTGSNSSIVLDEDWKTTSNVDINNPYEFSGMVSAIHPGDYKCTIPISLTDGGKEYKFTIEMSTRPLGNNELTNTRSYSVSAETEAVHIDL